VTLGANSLTLTDVPDGATVAATPATEEPPALAEASGLTS